VERNQRGYPAPQFFLRLSCSFLLCLSLGCATYQNKVAGPRNLIKQGQISEGIEKLRVLAEKPGDDQLVYLLDYATALQIAGEYKLSNEVFLKADKLVDLNDFHSVSNITMATLGSETMIQYKGESYEKVLINAFLAINYLMLGEPDEALVEARRLNEKLIKMKMDGRAPYELNPFAKYLSALIWESDRKFDDAYIAFEESYKLDATNPLIGKDLIRASRNARRDESYKKWKAEFPTLKEDPSWYDRSLGEVVIIFQQGWGPEKHMVNGQYRFPSLRPVASQTQQLSLKIDGMSEEFKSSTIYNIEQVAIKTLSDDYGSLVARRVGGIAAKAVVADQIRQKNKLLGELSWIAMNLADQADLRQWSMLPQTIQMIRVRLKPGKYGIHLHGIGWGGEPTNDSLDREVTIVSGRKAFVNFRALR
jgi:uncharacterized protein